MSQAGRIAAFSLCLLLYVPVGLVILRSGNNPDDWRFLAGHATYFADVHGRWATHLGHNVLFVGHFLTPLHVVLAFGALFATSALIARRAVPAAWSGAATVAVFLAGSHHAYLTDVLHYQSLAGWFSIGLACSVAAMALIHPGGGARSGLRGSLHLLAAAQLLALSIGFYQSYALLGLVLPAIALVRIDSIPPRDALLYCGRALVACALALVLYYAELQLVLLALGLEAQPRFSGAGAEQILAKLPSYPGVMRNLLGGGAIGLPPPYRTLLLLGTLAALGLVVAAAATGLARPGRSGERGLAAARCLVGGIGAILLLPGIFWFAYPEPFLPGRAAGFVGFVVAGIALAAATALGGLSGRRRSGALAAGTAVAGLYGAVGAVASWQLWPIYAETSARDVALATAIEAVVREELGEAAPPAPIRLVGGVAYDDLRFGGFRTPSSLHPGIDETSIFEVLFGAEAPSGSMPASPRPCPAFPEAGSVFVSDGAVHVCLEAKGPFPEFESCTSIDRLGAELCFAPDMTVLRAPDCGALDLEGSWVEITLFKSDGRPSETMRFPRRAQVFPVGSWCYRFAGPMSGSRDRIEVRRIGPTEATRWTEALP